MRPKSCAMIEEAENLRTLEVENKDLRQELNKLKADHEKSIAQVLESSSMATEERDRNIALQDKKISDLSNELFREKDISKACRAELQSLREEKAKVDDVIFGPLNLMDSASTESRTSRLTQVGDLLHDFRQSLKDIGEVLKIPDMHRMSGFEVQDKAKEMLLLV